MPNLPDWATPDIPEWAVHMVNFGYSVSVYQQLFDRHSVHYTGMRDMRPVSDECLCPHCTSEGWYTAPPSCNHWRRFCDLCSGTREYSERTGNGWQRKPCDICADEWKRAVRFFRDALRSPRAAARRLVAESRLNTAA